MIFLEENINEITYDENWQNVSEPEYITAVASDNSEEYDEEPLQNNEVKEKHRKNGTKPILISIQLALCLAVAAAAFVMKSIETRHENRFKTAKEMLDALEAIGEAEIVEIEIRDI